MYQQNFIYDIVGKMTQTTHNDYFDRGFDLTCAYTYTPKDALESVRLNSQLQYMHGYDKIFKVRNTPIKIKFLFLFLTYIFCSPPLGAYYQYTYQNQKLYYYDNGQSNHEGAAYFICTTLLTLNNPAILGGLFIVGGTAYGISERDPIGGLSVVGIGLVELLLQLTPDRTLSYVINGGATLAVGLNSIQPAPSSSSPKHMDIHYQQFCRKDILLDYDKAKKIFFELVDRGYLKIKPFGGATFQNYTPSSSVVLSAEWAPYKEHVQWVLTQIYIYNQESGNPNIKFETPVTQNPNLSNANMGLLQNPL